MNKSPLIRAGALAAALPARDFPPWPTGATLALGGPRVSHLVGEPCLTHLTSAPTIGDPPPGVCTPARPCTCTPSLCTPPTRWRCMCNCCRTPCSRCRQSKKATLQSQGTKDYGTSFTWCVYPWSSLHFLVHCSVVHLTSPPLRQLQLLHSFFQLTRSTIKERLFFWETTCLQLGGCIHVGLCTPSCNPSSRRQPRLRTCTGIRCNQLSTGRPPAEHHYWCAWRFSNLKPDECNPVDLCRSWHSTWEGIPPGLGSNWLQKLVGCENVPPCLQADKGKNNNPFSTYLLRLQSNMFMNHKTVYLLHI